MLQIVSIKFGSHLYGTATPESDLDLKAVHVPPGRDILLGRVAPVINRQTKADSRAKNTADDVDFESFALQRYLGLVAEGQTVALDMLFAPDWSLNEAPHPLWQEIRANRHRIVTRRYAAFIGYCRAQANKYGIKGSRVAASRAAMDLLAKAIADLGTVAKLREIGSLVEALTEDMQHMAVVQRPTPQGGVVPHWEVCGRLMPFTATIKSAHEVMARLVKDYGSRSLAAERNEGVDWKSLSHAVRIARQAKELLASGEVIFPRPDAADILAMKLGERSYAEVSEEIDRLLPEIEAAAAASTLPDEPDWQWIDGLVLAAHAAMIDAAPQKTPQAAEADPG